MSELEHPNPGAADLLKREYWCFISYRHSDNKEPGRQWAGWLHQSLETYEVPVELVGTRNLRGETIPDRIFPVFRDEEELPADAELSRPIEDAIKRSRFMVVLCSPAAVQSRFVSDEVRHFKRLGRRDHVLAAILAGEPNASDAGDSSKECFPDTLRFEVDTAGSLTSQRTEPIAADFRLADGNQGWTSPVAYRQQLTALGLPAGRCSELVDDYRKRSELMLLKIVAGVLGVPVGVLTQRDKSYQLERQRARNKVLRRWLVAIGTLAVIALLAGVAAWRSKKEAQRQARVAMLAQRSTEGMMAASLNEVIVPLIQMGRRDVLDAAIHAPTRYLKTLPQEQQSAMALFANTLQLAEKKADAHALAAQGDVDAGVAALKKFVDETSNLARAHPTELEWQRNQFAAQLEVAFLLKDGRRFDAALHAIDECLRIVPAIEEGRPGNIETIKRTDDRLRALMTKADVVALSGRYEESVRLYAECLVSQRRLMAENQQSSSMSNWRNGLSELLQKQAYALARTNQSNAIDRALKLLEEARDNQIDLIAKDPAPVSGANYQKMITAGHIRGLADIYNVMVQFYRQKADGPKARDAALEQLKVCQQLVDYQPGTAAADSALITAAIQLAGIELWTGNAAQNIVYLEMALARLKALNGRGMLDQDKQPMIPAIEQELGIRRSQTPPASGSIKNLFRK